MPLPALRLNQHALFLSARMVMGHSRNELREPALSAPTQKISEATGRWPAWPTTTISVSALS